MSHGLDPKIERGLVKLIGFCLEEARTPYTQVDCGQFHDLIHKCYFFGLYNSNNWQRYPEFPATSSHFDLCCYFILFL